MDFDEDLSWTTEMDYEILGILSTGLTLGPTAIAENIDRSQEGVSRRLNTLQAGGLVSKVDRGKYQITNSGLEAHEILSMRREEFQRHKRVMDELGLTMEQYQEAVEEEYRQLLKESDGSADFEELLKRAFKRVDEGRD